MTPSRQHLVNVPSRTGATPVRSAEQVALATRPAATPVSHVRQGGFGAAPYTHQYCGGGGGGSPEQHFHALYMGAAASSPEAETAASGEASEARGRKPRRRRQQQDRPQRVQFEEVSPGRREGVSSVEMLIDHEAAHQARGYGGNAAFIAGAKADAAALSGTQRASPIEAQRRLAHSRQLLRSLEVELLAADAAPNDL